MNSKILNKIFWFAVALPFVLVFFLDQIATSLGLNLDTVSINNLRYAFLVVSIIGSVVLMAKNYQSKVNNPIWHVAASIFIIASAGLFYLSYIIAHINPIL